MKLDEKIKELIAVGASITAHCQPCLEYHSMKALELGSNAEEIAEAIEVGKRVQFVSEQAKSASVSELAKASSFGCCS
ncbi:MAG: carboxymuconolactone decarboxylase family protein [Deltaproteobacteria bacterium]|nr:carboxymuconolactone decarboxylase family protein [Deltaproteobacteria bacterium]